MVVCKVTGVFKLQPVVVVFVLLCFVALLLLDGWMVSCCCCCCLFVCCWSPRGHLHVVGMLRNMSDINQPSLPTPFYSALVSASVFMALSTVFIS